MNALIKAVEEIRKIQLEFDLKPMDVVQSYLQLHEILQVLRKNGIINETSCLHHDIRLDFILLTLTEPETTHVELFTKLAEKYHRSYYTIKDLIYDMDYL